MVSVESWLQLVMRQTHVILSDASVTMSSSLPPETQETAQKRLNMRGSVRQHRKKKVRGKGENSLLIFFFVKIQSLIIQTHLQQRTVSLYESGE